MKDFFFKRHFEKEITRDSYSSLIFITFPSREISDFLLKVMIQKFQDDSILIKKRAKIFLVKRKISDFLKKVHTQHFC